MTKKELLLKDFEETLPIEYSKNDFKNDTLKEIYQTYYCTLMSKLGYYVSYASMNALKTNDLSRLINKFKNEVTND